LVLAVAALLVAAFVIRVILGFFEAIEAGAATVTLVGVVLMAILLATAHRYRAPSTNHPYAGVDALLLALAAGGVACVAGVALSSAWFGRLTGLETPGSLGTQFVVENWLVTFATVVIRGASEEVFLRGLGHLRIAPLVGPRAAEALVVVVFVLLHVEGENGPHFFLFIALLGVVCGRLTALTGSPVFPAIAHAVANGGLVLLTVDARAEVE
jgi:membrane protease YdiL (CAAX protease family)